MFPCGWQHRDFFSYSPGFWAIRCRLPVPKLPLKLVSYSTEAESIVRQLNTKAVEPSCRVLSESYFPSGVLPRSKAVESILRESRIFSVGFSPDFKDEERSQSP